MLLSPLLRTGRQDPPTRHRHLSFRRVRRLTLSTGLALACLSSTLARAVAPPQPDAFSGNQLELGSAAAPVTVVEYLSTTCSHCAAFERDTWPQVNRAFVLTGKVRFIVREMPTAPVAASAAGFLLARCAGADRYWGVVQALLQRQDEVLGAPTLTAAIAREQEIAGLNSDAAQACLSDPSAVDAINARRQAGLATGVDSTPYFIVDGAPLRPGARLGSEAYEGGELSYAQFEAAVRRAARDRR